MQAKMRLDTLASGAFNVHYAPYLRFHCKILGNMW
jgi:hypothetical protein